MDESKSTPVTETREFRFIAEGKLRGILERDYGTMKPIPTPGGMIPPHEASGQLHLALAVSKEDLTAWEKHLIARGIAIESKVSWPRGGQSIYFRDPDNHLVELATPGIWEVY
jgi:catechol 2,3-dioxygenase-like lactoylglutathione lyase family enzyme